MDTSNIGLIIILAVCALGLFAIILGSRMRKDTSTQSSAADDALNYGKGTAALASLRAEATGFSVATVWMLVIAGLIVLGAGLTLMYYGATAGLILLGLGFASIGFAALVRNGVSLSRASREQKSWVTLINIANARSLMFSYYSLMSAGIILGVLGLIVEFAGHEEYTTTGAIAAVVIPFAISVALGYARVRRG